MKDFTSFIDNVGLTLDSNGINTFNFPGALDMMDIHIYDASSTAAEPRLVEDSVMVDSSASAAASGANHPGLRYALTVG